MPEIANLWGYLEPTAVRKVLDIWKSSQGIMGTAKKTQKFSLTEVAFVLWEEVAGCRLNRGHCEFAMDILSEVPQRHT